MNPYHMGPYLPDLGFREGLIVASVVWAIVVLIVWRMRG
jgi:hypothetical protein